MESLNDFGDGYDSDGKPREERDSDVSTEPNSPVASPKPAQKKKKQEAASHNTELKLLEEAEKIKNALDQLSQRFTTFVDHFSSGIGQKSQKRNSSEGEENGATPPKQHRNEEDLEYRQLEREQARILELARFQEKEQERIRREVLEKEAAYQAEVDYYKDLQWAEEVDCPFPEDNIKLGDPLPERWDEEDRIYCLPSDYDWINPLPHQVAPPSMRCYFCSQNHFSTLCHKYAYLGARRERIQRLGRCYTCLRDHSLKEECRDAKKPCRHCRECGHHVSLCATEGDERR